MTCDDLCGELMSCELCSIRMRLQIVWATELIFKLVYIAIGYITVAKYRMGFSSRICVHLYTIQ